MRWRRDADPQVDQATECSLGRSRDFVAVCVNVLWCVWRAQWPIRMSEYAKSTVLGAIEGNARARENNWFFSSFDAVGSDLASSVKVTA